MFHILLKEAACSFFFFFDEMYFFSAHGKAIIYDSDNQKLLHIQNGKNTEQDLTSKTILTTGKRRPSLLPRGCEVKVLYLSQRHAWK